jgi:hypothetical protein
MMFASGAATKAASGTAFLAKQVDIVTKGTTRLGVSASVSGNQSKIP